MPHAGWALTARALPTANHGIPNDRIDLRAVVCGSLASSRDWTGRLVVDAGQSGAGSELTRQVVTTIGRDLKRARSRHGSYRWPKINKDGSNAGPDLAFAGPIVGVGYRFRSAATA